MPYTVQDHINDFLRIYPECGTSYALALIKEIDEVILHHVPLRRASVDLALVAGTREYDIAEEVLRIWSVRVYTSATSFHTLDDTDIDSLDLNFPNWRSAGAGSLSRWYVTSDEDGGQLGFSNPPSSSTLVVSSATNVNPIVVTTGTHGLSDGDQVLISGVTGNTAANGTFYVDVLSATTFALYTDEDLTAAVAGSGAYVSGGIAVSNQHPKAVLDCSKRTALTTGTNMPSAPAIKALYSDGMAMLWAKRNRPTDFETRKRIFEDALAEQSQMTMRRSARKQVDIISFKQRAGWRRGRGRCCD